jgi:hypothetical protein
MKRSLRPASFAILLLSTLFVSVAAPAQSQSPRHGSNASVIGRWGFTTEGTILGVGPLAAVGVISFDAQGNLSGKQTRSLNGLVAEETLSGTYTVNADGTGTITADVFQAGVKVRTAVLSTVNLDNGREARALFQSLVLASGVNLPSVITTNAKRLFAKEDN